jgi:hypothetical protein
MRATLSALCFKLAWWLGGSGAADRRWHSARDLGIYHGAYIERLRAVTWIARIHGQADAATYDAWATSLDVTPAPGGPPRGA